MAKITENEETEYNDSETNESEDSEVNDKKDQELIRIARERFDLVSEVENEFRIKALDDKKFLAGEQWPEDVKRDREADRRPCLTINRLKQSVKQVTNDQRQNRPSIKVHPIDDKADIETAKIFQGIIKHIEYNSNADVAYDTSFEGAAHGGRGFFRIITDYCDPISFEQEILIKRIRNDLSVYMDPNSQEPDGSDMEWCLIVEDISPDSYKAQFGESELASLTNWEAVGNNAPDWVNDTVRIAEYFYKEYEDAEIVLLSDKQVVLKSEVQEYLSANPNASVVAERKTKIPKIKWCKINAIEILEETEWIGKWIPVVPVFGDEIDINGKLMLEGIVRQAKDAQRMYNYWKSSETETIALAPKAPWIGVEGQFEDHENEWETANTRNHAYLEYRSVTLNGQPAPPPQRNAFEPPVAAITQASLYASDDLKATTGIYDASLGNRSNENSGVAIQRRNMQAQTGNFHFVDNLTRSIRHAGRILLDIIPKVYDTPRAVRIVGENDEHEVVRINEIFERKGKKVRYDLGAGKYDVAIDTGPSFATKRQEAAQSMLEMGKANPQITQFAGDLMVKNMDWPGAQEIAERLKKTLPPGLADDENQKQQPIPPQVKAQMDQAMQMVDQLTQQLNQANDAIEKKTLELESRERIEFAKIQAQLEIKMAEIGSKESQVLLAQQVQSIRHRLDLLNIDQPIEQDEPQINQSFENQNLENGSAGPSQGFGAPQDQQQQPTGGMSPGSPME